MNPILHLSDRPDGHAIDLSADRYRKQGFRAYVAGVSGSGAGG